MTNFELDEHPVHLAERKRIAENLNKAAGMPEPESTRVQPKENENGRI